MCTEDTQKKAKNTWNHWLDERDLAPGEAIAEWFRKNTQDGVRIATEYAKAGLEKAVSRADTLMAGRSLLDSGTPAQEAILLKQQCDQAVAADLEALQTLRYMATHYQEEAAFATDPKGFQASSVRAQRYGQVAGMLGDPPAVPSRSPVEQDALSVLQFRQTKAHVAKRMMSFQDATDAPTASSSSKAAAPRPSASEPPEPRTSSQDKVELLLQELFRLHDLKNNGMLEEGELIKMNEKVSLLHYGKEGTDKAAIQEKYRGIFRKQLNPAGEPVPFATFAKYMTEVLDEIDRNPDAQIMMLEQFCAEAELARGTFQFPSLVTESDYPYIQHSSSSSSSAARPAMGPSPAVPAASKPQLTMADRAAENSREAAPQAAAMEYAQQAPSGGYGGPSASSSAAYANRPRDHSPLQAGIHPQHTNSQSRQNPQFNATTMSSATSRQADLHQHSQAQQMAQQKSAIKPSPDDSAMSSAVPSMTQRRQQESGLSSKTSKQAVELPFAKGEQLQVWSDSKKSWLHGVVAEAFAVAQQAEGFAVPAGTLKVTYGSGTVKWIMPAQVSTLLRRKPS